MLHRCGILDSVLWDNWHTGRPEYVLGGIRVEYTSRAVGGTALGVGIGGLTLGAANAVGGIVNALSKGCHSHHEQPSDPAVSRYDLALVQQVANKDMEIAYWRGQDETNNKISASYANLESQINALAREVRANKDEQNGVNLQQAVYNGANTAAVSCMKGQIEQLFSLTSLRIPNTSLCPGYGNVTVTPAAATTA